MKFESYLNEAPNKGVQELLSKWPIIEKNSKLILRELRYFNNRDFLFHKGSRTHKENVVSIKKLDDIKRGPLDMPLKTHKVLNDLFKQKFGWKAREGIFCTSILTNSAYGMYKYIILPIGQYQYVWSPYVYDLYFTLRREADFIDYAKNKVDNYAIVDKIKTTSDLIKKEEYKVYERLKEIVSTYKDKDVCKTKRRVEISFKCAGYYRIKAEYENVVKNLIYGKKT